MRRAKRDPLREDRIHNEAVVDAPGAFVEGAQEGASYDRASQDDSEFVREPVLVD